LLFKENEGQAEDEKHNQTIMLYNINSLACFLNGIPQKMIDDLSEKQRQVMSKFFKDQFDRFNH